MDPTLVPTETTKKAVANKENFQRMLDTHCKVRHYMFSIKKCGQVECSICKKPRLPQEVFKELSHLLDPLLESAEKYKGFSELYGTNTTEEHRPSLGKVDGRGGAEDQIDSKK